MKHIDMDTWKRREHFQFFYRMDYPQFNLCANIDITTFHRLVKKENIPFYFSMIHSATRAANSVEEFRYRISSGQVILHESTHPCFTFMDKDDELFKFVQEDFDPDIHAFTGKAQQRALEQKEYFCLDTLQTRNDLVHFTCIPWVSFTHLSHTITLNRDDAAPRIAWGKFFTDGNRTMLPVSVQVHHALADGVHISQFLHILETICEEQR